MKNIKTSWLSREALALGVFTGLMSVNVALYFFDVSAYVRVFFEAMTLVIGIFGIYAQGMIYQIVARPSWNRKTTLFKFFGVAYIGMFLVVLVLLIQGANAEASSLLSLSLMFALAQAFFSFEDKRNLSNPSEYKKELDKTKRLYSEFFANHQKVRLITFVVGALFLPLLVTAFVGSSASIVILALAIVLMSASEFIDRFLFYATVVPLNMAGNFFAGKQRH